MPLFSVIIPLYNKENFIEATLQSVFMQTFTDYEIIIVNDGSTDASAEVVKKAIQRKPKAALINQKNQGLSATRNNAIHMAKGEIIALLDADDLWDKNYLSEIYKLYKKFPDVSLFGTDYFEKYSNNNILEPKKNIEANLKETSFLIPDFFKANWFQPIIAPSCFSIKKEVFYDLTFNEKITFAEDVDFYIKSNLKYKFAYCYNALATVHFNVPNQMTSIGFKGKQIPNFDFYESDTKNHPSLKKYLDYSRYYLLISAKIANDTENYNALHKHLDTNNLYFKQRLLLNLPTPVLKLFRWVKKLLLKQNIRLTSY